MKQTMPLGRVAGIRIGAHWSVLVMVVLIGWLLGAQVLPGLAPHEPAAAYWAVAVPGAVAFIAALLAHELAHSLVARRHGVPVTSITLWALGGVSELGGEPPTARADLLIAAAGPATSLAAGLVFGGIAAVVRAGGGPVIAVAALGWLALMNVFLAVFNLLPGAPLDGGRILRAALWMRHGDRARAAQSAAAAGRVLGAVLIAAGAAELLLWGDAGGLWLAVIGMFVMSAATAEATAGTATAALAGLRVSDVMTPGPRHRRHLADRLRFHRPDRPGLGPDRVSRHRPRRITGRGHRGQATGPGAAGQPEHHHAAAGHRRRPARLRSQPRGSGRPPAQPASARAETWQPSSSATGGSPAS